MGGLAWDRGPLRVRVLTEDGWSGTPTGARVPPGALGLRLAGLSRRARLLLSRVPPGPAFAPRGRTEEDGDSLTFVGTAEALRGLPMVWREGSPALRPLARRAEETLDRFFSRSPYRWRLAHGRELVLHREPRIMGVVNLTPDSFFDGGRFRTTEEAVSHARALAQEGAALIDLGGESTRPGARPLSPSQELRRILPAVERLSRSGDLLLSVDTRHADVARRALRAGAHVVNDVRGLRDPELRRVVRRAEAGAVVMHMRGTPRTMQRDVRYSDLRGEVYAFLEDRTRTAVDEGIAPEALVVDPGLGFGKSFEGTLELLGHVGEFRGLGFPVLVGASRKGFLGAILGGAPPADRLEASVAAALLAVERGASLVRVHDVGPTARAFRVLSALWSGSLPVGPSAAASVAGPAGGAGPPPRGSGAGSRPPAPPGRRGRRDPRPGPPRRPGTPGAPPGPG